MKSMPMKSDRMNSKTIAPFPLPSKPIIKYDSESSSTAHQTTGGESLYFCDLRSKIIHSETSADDSNLRQLNLSPYLPPDSTGESYDANEVLRIGSECRRSGLQKRSTYCVPEAFTYHIFKVGEVGNTPYYTIPCHKYMIYF